MISEFNFIEVVMTFFVFCMWILGYVFESKSKCESGLSFWTPMAMIFSIVRVVSIVQEWSAPLKVTTATVSVNWLVVGLIVLMSCPSCVTTGTPILYNTTFVYLIMGSIVFGRFILLGTLKKISPRFRHRVHVNYTFEDSFDDGMSLTPAQSTYWKLWLRNYGCEEIEYSPKDDGVASDDITVVTSMIGLEQQTLIPAERSDIEHGDNGIIHCGDTFGGGYQPITSTIVVPDDDIECGGIINTEPTVSDELALSDGCTICLSRLQDFGPSSTDHLIVNFPCHGGHYFHATCLKRWLKACSNKVIRTGGGVSIRRITCPNCREEPSLQKSDKSMRNTNPHHKDKQRSNTQDTDVRRDSCSSSSSTYSGISNSNTVQLTECSGSYASEVPISVV